MQDRTLEKLLRMVGELEDLAAADAALRPAVERPRLIRSSTLDARAAHPGRMSGHWWHRLGYGAVAAAVLACLLTPRAVQPVPRVPPIAVAVVAVSVCHDPPHADRANVELFRPTCDAGCSLLAIFREWNAECGCLLWKLHEWENGAAVAELPPGETAEIPLNVSGDPPVEQVLLLAVARTRETLPTSGERAEALLECLNDAPLSSSSEHDVGAYTSAVAGCLPEGVTILPQTFVVRSE